MGDQHKALIIEGLTGSSGGGGGGTSDYTDLANKPQINGVTLSGNKTGADLGLVPAENGKGLSTEDYTTAEKTKLAGIEPEANKTVVDTEINNTSTNPVENKAVYEALSGKVDKVNGKQLSTEDFTTAYKKDITILYESPLNHNGIYRGKDLTNVYTVEEMYEMVHDGSFYDLFLGDYFTKSITTDIMTRFTGAEFESGVTYYEVGGDDPVSRTFTETEDTEPQSGKIYCTKLTKTENVTPMFGAFNYYYNIGDTALTTHHAVLIPRNAGFATAAKMNNTNTTAGGYYGSDMHQIVLPCYAKSLKTMLGNHLLSHRTLLSAAVNTSTPSMAGAGMTGASTTWSWENTELQLMTEQQLFGSGIWASSAYDVSCDGEKLPVFNFINPIYFDRSYFWSRSVVSSTGFARCNNFGGADIGGASATFYVRPEFLFG